MVKEANPFCHALGLVLSKSFISYPASRTVILQTSQVIWELVKNAKPQAQLQAYYIRKCCRWGLLRDSESHCFWVLQQSNYEQRGGNQTDL